MWQIFSARAYAGKHFQFVFTPAGAAVFIIVVIGLVRSLFLRNSYEIVIFSAALFLLLVLGIIGAWKTWKLKTMETGWKPPSPMTACAGEETVITGLDPRVSGASIPLFFRLHFIINGRFYPSGCTGRTAKAVTAKTMTAKAAVKTTDESCSVFVETSVKRGETSAKIPFDFPMSGIFRGDGYCQLRDIFGFFSFYCGRRQHSTIMVRSSPCFGKEPVIKAQTGAEDRRSKPSADEERYYMREYSPGDRFRDINWKSSEKIDSLITRISTDNQEKITRMEIHLRNFGAYVSLEALWLLDRTKAQLSYFIRTLLEQNSSFVFDVYSAGRNWEIEDINDMEEFLNDLSGISLMPLTNEGISGSSNNGNIYVFSTACDTGLPAFLLANSQRPVSLFLIQPAEKNKNENAELKAAGIEKIVRSELKIKTEILRLGDFTAMGCAIHPRWYARGKIKSLSVNTNKTDVFYAQVKN